MTQTCSSPDTTPQATSVMLPGLLGPLADTSSYGSQSIASACRFVWYSLPSLVTTPTSSRCGYPAPGGSQPTATMSPLPGVPAWVVETSPNLSQSFVCRMVWNSRCWSLTTPTCNSPPG